MFLYLFLTVNYIVYKCDSVRFYKFKKLSFFKRIDRVIYKRINQRTYHIKIFTLNKKINLCHITNKLVVFFKSNIYNLFFRILFKNVEKFKILLLELNVKKQRLIKISFNHRNIIT